MGKKLKYETIYNKYLKNKDRKCSGEGKCRLDIINNLPHGAMIHIAKKCGISKSAVSQILHGHRKNIKVIKEAERIAAWNIWVRRFCKYVSEWDDYEEF